MYYSFLSQGRSEIGNMLFAHILFFSELNPACDKSTEYFLQKCQYFKRTSIKQNFKS